MKTLAALVVSLVLFTISSMADVIIWSGAGSLQVGDGSVVQTRPRSVFLVADQASLQSTLVIVTPQLRTVQTIGAFNLGYTEIATRPVRTIFLSNSSTAFTNVNAFQHIFIRFKGAKSTLFLRAANQNSVALPKVLSAQYNDLRSTPLAVTGTFTFRFDIKRTQGNNAAGRNLTTAVNDIIGGFVAKGYTVVP